MILVSAGELIILNAGLKLSSEANPDLETTRIGSSTVFDNGINFVLKRNVSPMVNRLLFPASSEFTALCRSQVSNLQEGLNADRGAVYLTKELTSGTRQLIPIVVYPEDSSCWEETVEKDTIVTSDDSLLENTPFELPASASSTEVTPQLATAQPNLIPDVVNQNNQHQIVFPLLHENVMMGLLVVARQQAQWSQWEFTQIQRTATTIALACVLDQRQGLSQQQLREQQWQQQRQRDQLDDILHQLRNPLMALRTFGKLLLKRFQPEDDEKKRSLAENVLRESERLQQLLQEMGDYLDQIGTLTEEDVTVETQTKPLLGSDTTVKSLPPSQTLNLETLALNEVLQPIVNSMSAIAQDHKIDLKTDIPDHLPPIQANRKALQEVLSNLLDNAIKYTPEQGTVEVVICNDKPNQQGIIIRDNGAGIPPDDQPKIFQRHYRGVQSEGDIPGTGLGLAIARDYVEQMQGEIELISPAVPPENPTHGTAFIVWLKR
ncbi:GAF sensor signal transduction histidine kinase [Halothece sp. PCC 7418]|uniref:GAF domain-containing sensor histidine kinase n=1 Tax=Halothece sp. (strain PCC 7418) TaxID=65093 RepID=UPI0002A06BF4|nr:ATP-binding protein [Halothece sp. PCC 7418]AFZ45478.1 GAF sensor signal transduction histidine kinase [Halothece sp. PCC 7418]